MSDTQFKVGDKVRWANDGGDTECTITAVGETCVIVRNDAGETCWHKTACRLIPTPPAAPPVPATPECGYWERDGKRFKLAEPLEYRLAKKGEHYEHRGSVSTAIDDHRNLSPSWILREVPSVRRWIANLPNPNAAPIRVPLIDDGPGSIPRLDRDTIGRPWAIEWAAARGQHGVVAMLKQEQETEK